MREEETLKAFLIKALTVSGRGEVVKLVKAEELVVLQSVARRLSLSGSYLPTTTACWSIPDELSGFIG
uniref:hypothetical protein n=1 Tax=Salmonella sp. TaxID=599 RepID=UPI001CDA3CC9|nr:hypothetical protein [Salmonella sp.]